MFSRRRFLHTAAAGALLGAARGAGREHLREFTYADVQLTGGPLKAQYDWVHAHFLSLDNDRLLKVYRQPAGLPAHGADMGGGYDADGFVPGHTIGQYISGLARMYATTRHPATLAKVKALVGGYGATLGADGYPYASEKAAVTWPCYILDKYVVGMLDAHRLAGVAGGRELLPRIIRGASGHIPDHTYDRTPDSPKQAPYDEPYILPENLFNSYEATGDPQWLAMAKLYLLNKEYFDPLAQGKNLLPGNWRTICGRTAWSCAGDRKSASWCVSRRAAMRAPCCAADGGTRTGATVICWSAMSGKADWAPRIRRPWTPTWHWPWNWRPMSTCWKARTRLPPLSGLRASNA